MTNDNLKISIITVCLNSEKFIEKTIESVINQTYSNIEYIIIEGKSTDNTLNILNKYKPDIDILISEKDNGIYDAMNKGLNLAHGDFIYFLNSGDYLYDKDTLAKIITHVNDQNKYDIIYGDFIYFDENKSEYREGHPSVTEIVARGVNHQSILVPKMSFEKFGYFDDTYKIFADLDWILRAVIKNKQKINYIKLPIAYYLEGGMSEKYYNKYLFEKNEIMKKYVSLNQFLKFAVYYPREFLIYVKDNTLNLFQA
ncbi:MAG: glycosyltransferase family 2 protein [Methanosarcina sp.]|nr:glycosyltransferase family 2 protein [Methanosarcina sp.]MDD4522984.1 glycosyltransferase family 2 protein [Methanosarcina sp.]